MNFLSENSSIVTSYQRNLNLSPTMTTKTNEGPIDAKNVSEIWKNNFSVNNNNNTSTTNNNNANTKLQLNGSTHVLKTRGNMNHNKDKEMDETSNINQPNDKETINIQESDGTYRYNNPSNGACKVDLEKFSNAEENDNNHEVKDQKEDDDSADTMSPSHHARRPMNAFLIFCKKHRPIVRKIFPTLENRGVTRILGEWWSLLDAKDKDPYTKLAKQYKDAFFDAHPDFKWYKLPAPPLRTLPTRPTKPDPSPPVSPIFIAPTTASLEGSTSTSTTTIPANVSSRCGLFTPGKLADESQIGMLSSLFTAVPSPGGNQNKADQEISSATPRVKQETVQYSEPPKPLKKRIAAEAEVKTVSTKLVRNLFEKEVVDHDDETGSNGRKSYRKGKGNRYADIMANGKLIKNKRSGNEKAIEGQLNVVNNKLELTSTIKKLQERLSVTNGIVGNLVVGSIRAKPENQEHEGSLKSTQNTQNQSNQQSHFNNHSESHDKRIRTISEISEMSDVADYSKAIPSFDLDARISELPNLSYDTYIQKKKATKKRKPKISKNQNKAKKVTAQSETNKKRTFTDAELGLPKTQNDVKLSRQAPNEGEKQTGSKKRKNKHNITHLKNNTSVNAFENDMSGLATLAEIASNLSCNNNDGGFIEKII